MQTSEDPEFNLRLSKAIMACQDPKKFMKTNELIERLPQTR